MLSCYQTENKHATLIIEKIILKLFKNKNCTKRKEKEFTHISLGVCALCFLNLHCTTFRIEKKKIHESAIIFKLLGGLRSYIKK